MKNRLILVSSDVFAALWATRQPDEDCENAILERILGLSKSAALATPPLVPPCDDGGIRHVRFGVYFPEGFEIFRTYKGQFWSAVVQHGLWLMNGRMFTSLFALSMAVSDSRENPWVHWRFQNPKGKTELIRALRTVPGAKKIGRGQAKNAR